MICAFHGIWMAFKKDVLALLDEFENEKMYGKLNHFYTNSYLPIRSTVIYGLTLTICITVLVMYR
jgi:hypothetical protein